MPEPINPGNTGRCGLLRTKWMFIQVEDEPGARHGENGPFWCVHTQNCLGPDGEVANSDNCKPGRSCYEPV